MDMEDIQKLTQDVRCKAYPLPISECILWEVFIIGEDELRYGQFGRLVMVPAEAPIGTHAGRFDQSDRYGWMTEPRSNYSERPDLHAGRVQWTDPRTGAHHSLPLQKDLSSNMKH
ncbi:hypothetical protein F2Q69_00012914 [Brassica cretica]|uniref:Uncharacterized protein n=1 Tax=Brassica cretica TaxID=69181 RepID=A0A8S9QXN2_BRACR|nr:hypothetical protein F2Q69_00012914 [Brassica cretica]